MRTTLFALFVLTGLMITEPLSAQTENAVADEAEQSGKEKHDWLTQLAGTWTGEFDCDVGPGQPPMKCGGTLTASMLGKFWLTNKMEMEFGGTTSTGVQTLGYDSKKECFVGTWIDSSTEMMWHYEGELTKAGNKLVLRAEGPNVVTGEGTSMYRDSFELESADVLLMKSEMQVEDGSWQEFMSGKLTRQK